MFQLEHELQEWSKRFGRMEVMRSSDIEELAQHVRDSIAVLTAKGLSEEESFLVATRRVGQPGPVGREFGKVNGGHVWGQRVFWMLAGVVLLDVCQLTISAVAGLSQVFAALAGGDGAMMGYTFVGITALGWFGLAIGLYRLSANQHHGDPISRRIAQFHGGLIGLGIVFVVVASMATRMVSQIVVAKWASIADMGQAAKISALPNTIFTILLPVAFLFVMLAIRSRMQDAVAAEQ